MKAILVFLGVLHAVASFSMRKNLQQDAEVLTDVESVQVSPSYNNREKGAAGSKPWRITLTFGDGRLITMNLNEMWQLNGIVATEGAVYQQLNGWVPCGYARFSISMDELSAQGVFTIHQHRMHLHRRQGKYTILNEEPLQRNIVVSKYEDLGMKLTREPPLLFKRELSDASDVGTTPWPSFSDLQASVNNASVCYPKRHLAPIGVAADSNFIGTFESSQAAQLHIVDTVNKASQVWEDAFNISLSLSEIIMGDSSASYNWNIPCNSSDNTMDSLESRLNALSDWRKSTRPWDGLALWSLFSNCPSSDVIGLAWQSTACKPGGVNILHHSVLDYQILAHESGHVFGAVHDCVNTTCVSKSMSASSGSGSDSGSVCCPYSSTQCDSESKYVMSPGSEINQEVFSRCTQGNVCSAISNSHINSSCLVEDRNQDGFHQPYCSSIFDPDKYEECLRDVQCRDSMNETSAYSCGSLDDCKLSCYNKQTGKCEKLDILLIHPTACKDKNSVRTNHAIPRWGWALMVVGCVSAAIVSIYLILLYFRKSRKKQQEPAGSPFDNNQQKNITVSPPNLQKKTINREPITGLPPILPYNIFRDPSTMKPTYMDTDVGISYGSPLTKRSSASSSSYSDSDIFK